MIDGGDFYIAGIRGRILHLRRLLITQLAFGATPLDPADAQWPYRQCA